MSSHRDEDEIRAMASREGDWRTGQRAVENHQARQAELERARDMDGPGHVEDIAESPVDGEGC